MKSHKSWVALNWLSGRWVIWSRKLTKQGISFFWLNHVSTLSLISWLPVPVINLRRRSVIAETSIWDRMSVTKLSLVLRKSNNPWGLLLIRTQNVLDTKDASNGFNCWLLSVTWPSLSPSVSLYEVSMKEYNIFKCSSSISASLMRSKSQVNSSQATFAFLNRSFGSRASSGTVMIKFIICRMISGCVKKRTNFSFWALHSWITSPSARTCSKVTSCFLWILELFLKQITLGD